MQQIINFLLFLLSSYAITFVLVDSHLFKTPRKYLEKFNFLKAGLSCYFCTGFWASGLAFTIQNPTWIYYFDGTWRYLILSMLGGATFIFWLNKKLKIMDHSIPEYMSKEEFDSATNTPLITHSLIKDD